MPNFSNFDNYSTNLNPASTFLVGFSNNAAAGVGQPALKEIKINIGALTNTVIRTVSTSTIDYVDYNYYPTPPLSAFLIGYMENDNKIIEEDPDYVPLKIRLNDLLDNTPIKYTYTTNVSSAELSNIGIYNNENTGNSYSNIIIGFKNSLVKSGNESLILNSEGSYFVNTSGCCTISTTFNSLTGEKNLSIGGSYNEINGTYNTIIGTSSDDNIVYGISNGIFNSIFNDTGSKSDFTTILGGGINYVDNSDFTSLLNTINNTVSGVIHCNVIGGENNTIIGTNNAKVSAVTLIGVYDRTITPTNSFCTITENLSVLQDFSSSRIILTAPNGAKFALVVTNSGALSTLAI